MHFPQKTALVRACEYHEDSRARNPKDVDGIPRRYLREIRLSSVSICKGYELQQHRSQQFRSPLGSRTQSRTGSVFAVHFETSRPENESEKSIRAHALGAPFENQKRERRLIRNLWHRSNNRYPIPMETERHLF